MKKDENFWDSSSARVVVGIVLAVCLFVLAQSAKAEEYEYQDFTVKVTQPKTKSAKYVNVQITNTSRTNIYCYLVSGSYDFDFWLRPGKKSRPYRVLSYDYYVECTAD